MADRSREMYKISYPDIEWSLPNVKSVLSSLDSMEVPLLKFCNGNWICKIERGCTCITFYLRRELFKGESVFSSLVKNNKHNMSVSFKSFVVKQNGMESPLQEEYFCSPKNMVRSLPNVYETSFLVCMPWTDFHETDGLKIICRFLCFDCPVKLAYVPSLSNREVNTLKRKHSEEEVIDFAGSKGKVLRSSGADALLRDIKNLLTSGSDSDVTIKVKDREFRAHKNILRVRSPVFFKTSHVSNDLHDKKNGIIDITDCEPDAFQEFLNYLYSGELDNVPMNIVCNLYYIGDKYEVEEIKKICVSSMSTHLSVETFYEILAFAQLYKESTLLETTSEFFSKNVKAIIVTDNWLSFLKEYPVAANELHIKAADR